jgi:23S rRNA G2069 N7-methylase RlmK/C1962 C5-methylase RlmI
MHFLRLPDKLTTPLFENEDILAIDKPYGISTHTNDSKSEHAEFIQDGLIEMLEKTLEKKLYIIHRLDKTTTGVIIFGKTPDAAKKYSEYFFNREVKKTYLFLTGSKSTKSEFKVDQAIHHSGKELEASTEFQFLSRTESYELWLAKPYTGRNHQIRIHAKAGGLAILGDALYGGAPYSFLCLHNQRIEFPNGIVVESKVPAHFQDLKILEDTTLARALFEADRRIRLYTDQNTVRWVHGKDFSIDQFGDKLVLNWNKELWTSLDEKRFSQFAAITKKQMVKKGLNIPAADQVWIHREPPLNQRLQRDWVSRNVQGKSILSIFSQNCGFGLAAAMGKADQIISVEANAKALAWGRQNFEQNSLDLKQYKFLCRDSLVYLKQMRSREIKFDLIICEAPSFYRGEKGIFKIEKDVALLLVDCMSCLRPKGQLLFSTAHEGFLINDLRKVITDVQKSLKLELRIDSIQASLDFELPDERPQMKSFLISKFS